MPVRFHPSNRSTNERSSGAEAGSVRLKPSRIERTSGKQEGPRAGEAFTPGSNDRRRHRRRRRRGSDARSPSRCRRRRESREDSPRHRRGRSGCDTVGVRPIQRSSPSLHRFGKPPQAERRFVQVDELQRCLLLRGAAESMCGAGAVGDAALGGVDEPSCFRAVGDAALGGVDEPSCFRAVDVGDVLVDAAEELCR
jgi:hypothetical protein